MWYTILNIPQKPHVPRLLASQAPARCHRRDRHAACRALPERGTVRAAAAYRANHAGVRSIADAGNDNVESRVPRAQCASCQPQKSYEEARDAAAPRRAPVAALRPILCSRQRRGGRSQHAATPHEVVMALGAQTYDALCYFAAYTYSLQFAQAFTNNFCVKPYMKGNANCRKENENSDKRCGPIQKKTHSCYRKNDRGQELNTHA